MALYASDSYDLGVYVGLLFPKVLGPEIGVVYQNGFPNIYVEWPKSI